MGKTFDTFLEQIKAAADTAQDIIDYDAAHNEEIRYAIDIVEAFLRRTHRICYGGQAINAYLPEKHKFYDPLRSIPDYDFLTPSGAEDIRQLVRAFKEAGFTEIGVRPGMHEGTMKIYINYTAVADVTEINPLFYVKLFERSTAIHGIQYMDANSLRMMMYLELSRPRGEVGRWEKVFERLELLNLYAPLRCVPGKRRRQGQGPHATVVRTDERRSILDFVVYEQRVLVGADVISFYKQRLKKPLKIDWFIGKSDPLLFYSPNVEEDAFVLKKQLDKYGGDITMETIESEAEFFPKMVLIRRSYGGAEGTAICGIIQESACHSYNTLNLDSGKSLRIGSFDTLITLYLSLTFQKKVSALFDNAVLCLVQQLIELQELYREKKKPLFPFISIECSGYQKQLSSLLREKVGRIKAAAAGKTRRSTRRKTNSR